MGREQMENMTPHARNLTKKTSDMNMKKNQTPTSRHDARYRSTSNNNFINDAHLISDVDLKNEAIKDLTAIK